MRTKDEIEKLVNDNINLAWFALRRSQRFPEVAADPEEFLSSAMLGLFKAARFYNSDRGKFSTYAVNIAELEVKRDVLTRRKSKHTVKTHYGTDFDRYLAYDPPPEFEGYGRLDELMACLTPKQRKLVDKYYGFNGKRMTRRALGLEQGCSGQWISCQLNAIHQKLAKQARFLGITLQDDQLIRKGT